MWREFKGFRGYPWLPGVPAKIYVLWGGKCLCGITKAMLAGISHRIFALFAFSQPEKKKLQLSAKVWNCRSITSLFRAVTGSFEGERCGEGEQTSNATPCLIFGYSCPLLVDFTFPCSFAVHACGITPTLSQWYLRFSARASPARNTCWYALWEFWTVLSDSAFPPA